MTKARRLRTPHDFQRVFREGRRASGALLICVALAGDDEGVSVGVSAGRALGGAVRRNRAKRLLREAARAVAPEIRSGTELVLVARSDITGRSFQDVEAELRRAIARLGVAC